MFVFRTTFKLFGASQRYNTHQQFSKAIFKQRKKQDLSLIKSVNYLLLNKNATMFSENQTTSGLYYKHITIINDGHK